MNYIDFLHTKVCIAPNSGFDIVKLSLIFKCKYKK